MDSVACRISTLARFCPPPSYKRTCEKFIRKKSYERLDGAPDLLVTFTPAFQTVLAEHETRTATLRHLNTALEYLSEETDGDPESDEALEEHREALLVLRKRGS